MWMVVLFEEMHRQRVKGEKYLKENQVNEKENESRFSEPEKLISGLNHRCTFHHISSFLNPQPQFSYDHLQLSPHQQYYLQRIPGSYYILKMI